MLFLGVYDYEVPYNNVDDFRETRNPGDSSKCCGYHIVGEDE